MAKKVSIGEQVILDWMDAQGWHAFPFQQQAWREYLNGKSGLLNAPTGCGKTFALYLPVLIEWINKHPKTWQDKKGNGLQLLWVTPLRALAKDIRRAMQEVCDAISLPWEIGMRSGDVSTAERNRQKKQMPEVLIITPESLHLMLAQKEYPKIFSNLHTVVIDEWHELLGSKRGVQVELALSRLKTIAREKQKKELAKKQREEAKQKEEEEQTCKKREEEKKKREMIEESVALQKIDAEFRNEIARKQVSYFICLFVCFFFITKTKAI